MARVGPRRRRDLLDHLGVRMTDVVERLRADSTIGPHDYIEFEYVRVGLRAEAADEIERLRTALQWLMKQPWKSIDKDNMEFQVTVTCYVRDALLAALERKP